MKQILLTDCTVSEALAQIDALEGLDFKNQNCLRLLTEEMFSMVNELLNANSLDYEYHCVDKTCTLCVRVRTRVDEEARKHFLSMSSEGRNAANKGIKGLLGALIESLAFADSSAAYAPEWRYGMHAPTGEYGQMWTLSHYMNYAPPEQVKKDWDGMEKSIIVNFADDVAIGVRSGKLEMIVTKTLA